MQRAISPARARFNRTLLEARRTRTGQPVSRLKGFGALGALGVLGGSGATIAVPAAWQVDPTALRQLAASAAKGTVPTAVLQPKPSASASPAARAAAPQIQAAWQGASLPSAINFRGLGALGLSPEAGAVGGKIASTAGGAAVTSAAAAGTFGTTLAASSIAGPIGIAAGIVIALAVSLFTKHYFNVGDSNAACAQLEALWQKYTSIQGHVAGRALGWQTMNQLMHAATGAGLFPGNDMHLGFHEGTLQCAGHGDWVDEFTGSTIQGNPGAACGAHNCLPDAFVAYQGQQNAVPPGTPDAVFLVDNILLPMNQSAKIPWIYRGAQNPQVHQLLYDLSDAYIAQHGSGSTPYVEFPAQQVGTPTAGAESAPVPVSSPSGPTGGGMSLQPGQPGYVGPTTTTPQTQQQAGFTQIGTDPVTGVPILVQPGNPQEYELVNGQLTPYNPTQVTTAPTPPISGSPGAPAQPAGTPTTGGMDANTLALIQSMMSQGASQSQAYTAALAQLAAQGVNTQSPAVQSQVAQATQNPTGVPPAGATAGISTQGFQMNSGTLAILGGSLLGVYLLYTIMEKKKGKKHD